MEWPQVVVWYVGQSLSWASFVFGVLSIMFGVFACVRWRRLGDAVRGVGCALLFWMFTIYGHLLTPNYGQTAVSRWLVDLLGIAG